MGGFLRGGEKIRRGVKGKGIRGVRDNKGLRGTVIVWNVIVGFYKHTLLRTHTFISKIILPLPALGSQSWILMRFLGCR